MRLRRSEHRGVPSPSAKARARAPRYEGPLPGLLPQEILDLLPEGPGLRVRLLAGDRGEPLEQLALLLREVRRRLDEDAHVLVAPAASLQRRDAPPLQA